MNPKKLFPLVVTDQIADTKAFYVDTAGFTVVHDAPEYLQVRYGDEDGPELCFMRPDAAPMMGDLPTFGGQGLLVSIPTKDADATHKELKGRKAKVVAPPADKPWGWRSFIAVDPNGVLLDFFHVLADESKLNATG